MHKLEFVGAVGAQNEFELEKDRIDVRARQGKCIIQEVGDCTGAGFSKTRSDTRSGSPKYANAIVDPDRR